MLFLYVLASGVVGALILVGLVVAIEVAFFFLGIDGETSEVTSIDVIVFLWVAGLFLTNCGPKLLRNERGIRLKTPVWDVAIAGPAFLGVILGTISTHLFWIGLWISVAVVTLRVWHYSWSKSHPKTEEE